MPPVKTVYVPWFGSQQGSSQKTEPDQIKALPRSLRDKSGNKRGEDGGKNPRSTLKVKIPKLTSRSLLGKVTEDNKTPTKWMLKPAVNDTKTTVNQGGGRQCNVLGANAAVADGDVFFFSQQSSGKATNEKEKAKLSVLKTISKMLEENQLIRQRLDALNKAK